MLDAIPAEQVYPNSSSTSNLAFAANSAASDSATSAHRSSASSFPSNGMTCPNASQSISLIPNAEGRGSSLSGEASAGMEARAG